MRERLEIKVSIKKKPDKRQPHLPQAYTEHWNVVPIFGPNFGNVYWLFLSDDSWNLLDAIISCVQYTHSACMCEQRF